MWYSLWFVSSLGTSRGLKLLVTIWVPHQEVEGFNEQIVLPSIGVQCMHPYRLLKVVTVHLVFRGQSDRVVIVFRLILYNSSPF